MKNKKGFTLIELLAIIVILAIIAVITVPIILNIIENSKKGAATDSAYGYKDAVQKAYLTKLSEKEDIKLNGIYTVGNDGTISGDFNDEEVSSIPISLSGTIPSSGSLTYSNNKFTEGWLVIGDYRVTFNQDGTITTIKNNNLSSNEEEDEEPIILSLEIGDTVNYTTTSNGQTLNNWKVFYIEGNYVYIIYGDYLPNSAVPDGLTGIVKGTGTYTHDTHADSDNSNRTQLLNALSTKATWNHLLSGTLEETAINYTTSSNTHIYAMGAPDLELYIKSWNAKNPANRLYFATTTSAMSDGNNGYYLGTSEDPSNPATYKANMVSAPGYSNTLYYPHPNDHDFGGSWGYWIASLGASDPTNILSVDSNGYVDDNYYYVSRSFRPIICLPASAFVN